MMPIIRGYVVAANTPGLSIRNCIAILNKAIPIFIFSQKQPNKRNRTSRIKPSALAKPTWPVAIATIIPIINASNVNMIMPQTIHAGKFLISITNNIPIANSATSIPRISPPCLENTAGI